MTGRPDPVEALADAVHAAHDPIGRLATAVATAWNSAPGSGRRVRLHVEPGPGQSALLRLGDVEVQLEGDHVRGLTAALDAASRSTPV